MIRRFFRTAAVWLGLRNTRPPFDDPRLIEWLESIGQDEGQP